MIPATLMPPSQTSTWMESVIPPFWRRWSIAEQASAKAGEVMSHNIEGKVVVITGASSGLGEATARTLSAQGAAVVLGARRRDRIQALASELSSSGGKALAVTTDVTDRRQVQNLVDAAVEAYGRVDVMVNNAGLMPQAPL